MSPADPPQSWKSGDRQKRSPKSARESDANLPGAAWRGKVSSRPGASSQDRYFWRAPREQDPHARRRWRRRVSLTVGGLLGSLLLGAFMLALIVERDKTPFLAIVATPYTWPAPPNAWAQEDLARFERLGDKGTLTLHKLSWQYDATDPETYQNDFFDDLEAELKACRDAGSWLYDPRPVIIYVSMHGLARAKQGKIESCLLPPGVPPTAWRYWLPLRELLTRISQQQDTKSQKKLVVLDCNRMDAEWSLGLLDNAFADGLQEIVDTLDDSNLFVLNATHPGEVAWSSPGLGGSIFGFFVYQGLEGWADSGDWFRRVSLHELADHVTNGVSHWARNRRNAVQRPELITVAKNVDFDVAFAVNAGIEGLWNRLEDEAEKPSPSRPVSWDKITGLWKDRSEFVEKRRRHDPVRLAYFERKLLWLEQANIAGAAYDGPAKTLFSELERLAGELKKTPTHPAVAFSLPLADHYLPSDEEGRVKNVWQSLTAGRTASRKDVEAALSDLDGSRRFPPPIEIHFLRMLDQHLDPEIWNDGLVGRMLALRKQAEELAAPEDPRVHYWLQALANGGDRNRRKFEDSLFAGETNSRRTRDFADEATADYDRATTVAEKVASALKTRDRAWATLPYFAEWVDRRRQAQESLADSQLAVPSSTGNENETDLAELIKRAKDLSAALESVPHDGRIEKERLIPLAGLTEVAEKQIDRLETAYGKDVAYLTLDTFHTADTAARFRLMVDLLRIPPFVTAEKRQVIWQLCEDFWNDTGETADLVRLAHETEGPGGATAGLSGSAQRTARLDEPTVAPRALLISGQHPALALAESVLGPTGATSPNEAAANEPAPALRLTLEGDRLREAIQAEEPSQVAQRVRQCLGALQGADSRPMDERAKLSEEARRARATAALLPWQPVMTPSRPSSGNGDDLRDDPVHQLYRLDLHNLLVWHAQRALDDFWASESGRPPHYFAKTAEAYLESAGELCDVASDRAVRELLAKRKESAQAAIFDIDKNTLKPLLPEQTEQDPTVSHAAGLPPGIGAYFVVSGAYPGTAASSFRLHTSPDAVFRRLAIPIDESGASGESAAHLGPYWLDDSQLKQSPEDLEAIALYRGHWAERAIAYRTPSYWTIHRPGPIEPAKVTVMRPEGEPLPVAFILDCSGSMSGRMANEGGATRFDVARDRLTKILTELADDANYEVGLWAYGYRYGFAKGTGGRYVPRPADYIPPEWFRKGLRPNNDVDPIRRTDRFTLANLNAVKSALETVKPLGQTPLYLAVQRVAFEDMRTKPGQKIIVAITDGKNEQQPPVLDEDEIDSRELEELTSLCRQRDIRIYMLGFKLDPQDQATADEFRRFAEATGGRFMPADSSFALETALRDAIRPGKFEVVDRQGSSAHADSPQDIGKTVTVETSPANQGAYSVRVIPSDGQKENATGPTQAIDLEGGENVQLRLERGEQRLVFLPEEEYEHAFSKAIDGAKYWLRYQEPEARGSGMVFRFVLQNQDPTEFTPRPREAWVNLRPVARDGKEMDFVFPFYERDFEPGWRAPVLVCQVENWAAWTNNANGAKAEVWFHWAPSKPDWEIPLSEAQKANELSFPELPGRRFRVLPFEGNEPAKVVVVEDADNASDLFSPEKAVRLEMEPLPTQTTHTYYVGESSRARGATVVHEFEFDSLPPDDNPQLRITRFESFKTGAFGPGEPLEIEVRGDGR